MVARRGRKQPAEAARHEAHPFTWTTCIVAIAAGALVLRLIHLASLRATPLFAVLIGDGQQYDAWATQIAGGQWIGHEVFYQTPLYPYLLAVIFKICGHHLFYVRVLQSMFGAASCALVCIAGRDFFDRRSGLVAGALLAVYPPAIFFDGLIQKSSLDLLLMALLLALLGEFLSRPQKRWLVGAGLAMGALALNRENARVLYPIVAAWLLIFFKDRPLGTRAAWAAVFTAAVAAVLLPVGARNYLVGGDFLISTSQFGSNFYIGNHAGAHGGYEELVPDHGSAAFERDDATRLAEEGAGRRLSPGEVSDYWLHRALGDIRRQPGAWATLVGRKLLITLNVVESVDTESIEVYADYSPLLRALLWFNFGIVLPLAVLGAWLTRADWRRLAVLYGAFAGLVLSIAIFYVLGRYRFPIVPIAMLFAGAAVSRVFAMFTARPPPVDIVPAAAFALIVAAIVNVPMRTSYDETRLNIGSELVRAGRPADAIPLLEQAARESPGYGPAHFDLGVALDRAGQPARAIDELTTAVTLQPQSFNVHETLAVDLWSANRREDALAHYREAARLHPDEAAVQNNLGNALLQMQRPQEALPHFEAALKLKPDFAEAHSNMALAYQTLGDFSHAVDHFSEASRLAPDNYGIRINSGNLLLRLGRHGDAIKEYEHALAVAPDAVDDRVNLLGHLAEAYAQDGRLRDGIDTLEKAFALAQSAGRQDMAQPIAIAIQTWRARLTPAR